MDLVVADGLAGLSDTAHFEFPGSDFQRCVVHKQRNVLNKVRRREKQALAHDIKKVFKNFDSDSTLEKAQAKLDKFCATWKNSYPNVVKSLQTEDINDYFTYIQYFFQVHRMIYTTNSVENLNKQIRQVTKTKVTFDKANNLLDLTFMVIKDFEANNWQKFPVHAFTHWPKKYT